MSSTKVVRWGDVAYVARIAFAESVQKWEALEWTWQAWEILLQAGLATYSTKIELYEVIVRFFALISFYIEFHNYDSWEYWDCWEYWVEDYLEWSGEILINDFHPQENNLSADLFVPVDDKRENLSDKIIFLINNALQEVIAALTEGFGCKSILFNSLWQSIKSEVGEHEPNIDEYEESYKAFSFYRTEVEIMNNEKILAWLENLADTYESEYDDEEEDDFYESKAELLKHIIFPDNTDIDLEKATGNIKHFFEGEVVSLEGFENPDQKPIGLTTRLKPKYSLSRCANKTGFEQADIERWLRAINRKKQAILCGSPGTGKTYLADKLAKHLIGGMDGFRDGFLELVQFHPAYAYEDFIQGIRPQARPDGRLDYQIVPGRFLEFCKKAQSREGLCVLIIDEINRANLTQVFGELMYLLEYRNKKIRLAGSRELFGIPENVRIIGTMNTADRSIALVDHALRRRFAFIELRPNYDVLRRYHEKKKTGFQVDGLVKVLKRLNNAIANKHYELGISFFLTENLAEHIEDIWQMEIEPYLEEYFYDQLEKVDEFRWGKIKQQVLP
jgi:5-methylcytosine-specific restriction protein B